jgi:hypothetical protein
MTEWSEKWLLMFHPQKCKSMNIAKTKKETEYNYYLKSFMKMTNRSGSNTDPCGMPDVTSFHSELFTFIITFYFLSAR